MAKGCIQKRRAQPPRRRLRKVSTHGGGQTHHPFAHQSHSNSAHKKNEGARAPCGARVMDDGLPSAHLRTLLERENNVLAHPNQLPKGPGVISWSDRNRETVWICSVGRQLGMGIDAVSLAVSIFDKVVTNIRVPVKYLNCVSASCVHIARKLCEDDEDQAWLFIDKLQLAYSPNELQRMELSVLGALGWDALLPSVERFVSLLLETIGGACLLDTLKPHIEAVLQDNNVHCEYAPSIVGLAIISHVLEATTRQWLPTTQQLVKMCKGDIGQFVSCRERVAVAWRTAMVPRLSAFSLLAPMDEDEARAQQRTPSPPPNSESAAQQMTSPRLQATPC